jgi:hypothetical protein
VSQEFGIDRMLANYAKLFGETTVPVT